MEVMRCVLSVHSLTRHSMSTDLIRGGPQHALAFVQRLIIDTGVEITALANEDAAVERSLNVLDRTPVIDLHKIGVVYVGLGQRGEAEILANSAGSQDYDAFLSALGSRVLLKECPMLDLFTGGLDTFDNLDGEWACYWRDQVQQLIFHVGTLMPTNTATDPRCNAKKRHIGNDFVTIVFDESGEDYAFDTISSQFNFVNVVVRPVRESVVKGMAQDATSAALDQLFSVSMQRRSDMPDIGPLAEPKIVVGAVQAAAFARAVSFHANVYAQVYEQLFRRQTGSSAASRSNSMGSSAAAPRNSTTGMPPSPMTSTGDARPLQRARPSLATIPAAQLSNVSLAVAANDDEYVSNTRERLRQLRRIAVRARSKCVSE